MFEFDHDSSGEDPFAHALETSRQFLLAIANAELPDLLRSKGGASDLVQDTMAAAHRSRDQFQGRTLADLRAWLRAILKNELAIFRRRYSRSKREVNREVPIDGDAFPPTREHAPVDRMISAERHAAFSRALDELPAEVRDVVLLRVESQLTFAAIADHLGRTEDGVRKAFDRAMERLRISSSGTP